MFAKLPKNTGNYFWTQHSVFKMKQYGLSEQRIKRVIRSPKRIETGIVKNTIAVMQPVSEKSGKWKQEIWAMYQVKNQGGSPKNNKLKIEVFSKKMKIISAWKYPGMSPKNNPIPEEIIHELNCLH